MYWEKCEICGKDIPVGEVCFGLKNGGAVCADCCTGVENLPKESKKTAKKTDAVMYFNALLGNHYKSLKHAQGAEQIENIGKKIGFVREAIRALKKEGGR